MPAKVAESPRKGADRGGLRRAGRADPRGGLHHDLGLARSRLDGPPAGDPDHRRQQAAGPATDRAGARRASAASPSRPISTRAGGRSRFWSPRSRERCPEEFVLVHGHLDGWHYGVGDNAVGNATLLELARVFQQRQGRTEAERPDRLVERPLPRSLRRLDLVRRYLRPRPGRALRRPGQLRFARLPLGDRLHRRDVDGGGRSAGRRRDPRRDRRGGDLGAPAAGRRLLLQQPRHLRLLHAQQHDAGRPARRRRATTRSAAAAATSPGTPRTTPSRSPTGTICSATSSSTRRPSGGRPTRPCRRSTSG